VWKIPIQLLPASYGGIPPVESMLLEQANQLLLLAALVGPIGCYIEQTDAVESSGRYPQSCMKDYNTAGLEGVAASTGAIRATGSNMWRACGSSTANSNRAVGLEDQSRSYVGIGSLSCIDEVSFKIKDTFQCARDRSGSRTTWTLLS